MREAAFRRLMTPRVSAGTIESYVAYLRRVEHVLGTSVDALDLSAGRAANVVESLRAAGVPAKSAGNCGSALAAYAGLAADG